MSVFHNTIAFTGIEIRIDYVRGLILTSSKVEVMCQTSRNNVERICGIFDHTILPEMKITTYYSHTPIVSTISILNSTRKFVYLTNVSCSLSDALLRGKRTFISVSTSVSLGKN